MSFTFYLLVGLALCLIMLPIVMATMICVESIVNDSIYRSLKLKGKIKYFISQLIEVEF